MIAASVTEKVPWGFVCGYPIKSGSGDLYGGGLYMDSSAANLTPQGKAIKQASLDFGDGKTLPFPPCKRGYIPIVKNDKNKPAMLLVACSFHEQARRKRLARDQGKLRGGEADPQQLFWSKMELTKNVESQQDVMESKTEQPNHKRPSPKENNPCKRHQMPK